MPKKKAKINECIILKSHDQYSIDDDRPIIPIRSKIDEFHILGHGVKNYIQFPQELISVRTFESEYIIKTEINTYNEYEALRIANERFSDVATSFSLVAKNKTVKIKNKRIKRDNEIYDFEIIGIFLKKNKELIRLKLPKPLISGRNFEPKEFPVGFLSQTKKYVLCRDAVFKKGLVYFQRATAMRHSGVFSDLEIILNFVKCIELICYHVGKELNRFGLTQKAYKKLATKKIIEYAGVKIGVTKRSINSTKRMWDIRSKADIAHQNLYFNPYSPKSTNAIINFNIIESNTAEFLRKYYKHREKNPCYFT
ncbi:MAG: hypothetical protein PHO90_02060 [Candidatus Pacebacteria bacterium]|nr:hypothetical protein [Candidatus Paceibacterota bacterium]